MTQLSIDFARRERDEGISNAVAKADSEVEGWSDLALLFIRNFCAKNVGRRLTGLELRQASMEYGLVQPSNPKAWGGPINRAARAKLLLRVGTVPDPNRHCNPVPLWECA